MQQNAKMTCCHVDQQQGELYLPTFISLSDVTIYEEFQPNIKIHSVAPDYVEGKTVGWLPTTVDDNPAFSC